ncbi:hypothetical protein [Halobacteriovorax sp. CON-3]|uniref:hypothetical protein n=1 Tax=Halobacteriovorax sp. CON-3 TaxID=3157710 RepID=UPI003722BE08
MGRLAPKTDVLRALFARSNNECAFRGCSHNLINDSNQFIAQVCHIEAASEGGERFNPNMTDEERRDYKNLIILCYAHHIETNQVDKYSVDYLQELKKEHENSNQSVAFTITDEILSQITSEYENYWKEIKVLNTTKHKAPEVALEIETERSGIEAIALAFEYIERIKSLTDQFNISDIELWSEIKSFLNQHHVNYEKLDDVPYYENPFENRNWEHHNLGIPNMLRGMFVILKQIELRYLEEYLKTNTNDTETLEKFKKLKNEFKKIASDSIIND